MQLTQKNMTVLEISSTEIPRAIEEIRTAPVRHTAVCDVDQMEQAVKNFLAI